jgi:hypothetical protein
MTQDSSKVRVAVTGQVMIAATSAAAPTGTGGTTVGFVDLGFVSEDGVTETRERSTEDIKAWQNAATVRTVITDATYTFQATLIETNPATVTAFYGATVTAGASDGNFVVIPSATGGRKSFILDIVDGAELMRYYIPQGEVTEVGDRTYASGEPIGYDVTITAYPDATLGGSAKVYMTALKTP